MSPSQPTAVLAEDERVLRDQLRELLAAAWPELRVVAEASDGAAALKAIDEHAPDVLFLDIHMPEASGLEVTRKASGRCHVVFVTAYDQYAVAAFEEGAVDYVMKPLSGARIAIATERLRKRLESRPADLRGLVANLAKAPARNGQYLRWINAADGEDVQLITIDEVQYFQSDTKYTRVVAANQEGLIRKSLKELLDELDPDVFWQVHRATIVNLGAVASVGRDHRGHVVLRLRGRDEVLPVSQTFAHLFRQM